MIKEPPVKENGHRARFDGDAGERAVREILKLTAGSAFFNMILLDRLMDYLNDNKQAYVTEADINNLLSERLLADPNGLKLTDFESLYSDDGDIEDMTRPKHNVLVLFLLSRCIHKTGQCKKDNISVPDEIPFKDQMSGERISNILNKLQSRGVVDVDSNGSYTIRVGLFDEWLYRKCSYEIINDIEDLK
jgi:hypothetical protein